MVIKIMEDDNVRWEKCRKFREKLFQIPDKYNNDETFMEYVTSKKGSN